MGIISKLIQIPKDWIAKAPVRNMGITGVSAALLAGISVFNNVGGFKDSLCKQNWFRPVCSALHWSGVADKQEIEVWQRVKDSQSCDGYREYVSKYGSGEFVTIATARLTAARRVEKEIWQDEIKPLPIIQPAPLVASSSDSAAQARAIADGTTMAQNMLCRNYASGEFRLKKVEVKPQTWDCQSYNGGKICGFSGAALCHVQTRIIAVDEDCKVQNP